MLWKKKNKGSVLMMVMMVMSIIIILGTAIGSLAIMNFKMKIANKDKETSFYITEAGLDETYGKLMDQIEIGLKLGNENVEDIYETIKEEESNINQRKSTIERDSYYNSLGQKIFVKSSNGIQGSVTVNLKDYLSYKEVTTENTEEPVIEKVYYVDSQKVKDTLEKWFSETYMSYMEAKVTPDYLKTENYYDLSHEGSWQGVPKFNSDPIIDTTNFKLYDKNNPNNMKISLDFKYVFKEMPKNIKADLIVGVPKYGGIYGSQKFKIKALPIFEKVITTDQDLFFSENSGTTEVEGDVYAYGGESDLREKGIIIDGSNVNTLGGDWVTNAYLKGKTGSTLDFKNGEIYANSVDIGKLENNVNIKLDQTSNLNIQDDLELNGTKSKFDISGNIYGFNDGSATTRHDESSAIVINSDDIGLIDGSTLKATGTGSRVKEIQETWPEELKAGNMISGVVYISDNNKYYKTGESVAVKGNYRTYAEVDSEWTAKNLKPFKSDIETLPPMFDGFEGDDTEIKISQSKIEYFLHFKDRDYIRKSGIDIGNVMYSLGAYIDAEGVKGSKRGYEAEINLLRDYIRNQYNNERNALGYEKSSDNLNKVSLSTFFSSKASLNSLNYDKRATSKYVYEKESGDIVVDNNVIKVGGLDRTQDINAKKNNIISSSDINILVTENTSFKGNIFSNGNVTLILERGSTFEGSLVGWTGSVTIEGVDTTSKAKGAFYGEQGLKIDASNVEGVGRSDGNLELGATSSLRLKGLFMSYGWTRGSNAIDLDGSIVSRGSVYLESSSAGNYYNGGYKSPELSSVYEVLGKYSQGKELLNFPSIYEDKNMDYEGVDGSEDGMARMKNLIRIQNWTQK